MRVLSEKDRGCWLLPIVLAWAIISISRIESTHADVFNMPVGQTNIELVTVGNPGNPGEPSGNWVAGGSGPGAVVGAVNYQYQIGKFEITIGQYAQFLNAVAVDDTYQLFNTSMFGNSDIAGIQQHGVSGGYSYSVIGSPNRPITHVGWGDAARFCNWLANGQPTGPQNNSTTEDGSYLMNGVDTIASLMSVVRKPGAQYVIPNENEWYKAAYHNPNSAPGNDQFWLYPTQSNTAPFSDRPGDSDAPDPAQACNYFNNDGIANGYNDGFGATGTTSGSFLTKLTDVGAYSFAAGPYGTFDQCGNVTEWNETAVLLMDRGKRGGDWGRLEPSIRASSREYLGPLFETSGIGFRIALVPEPSTGAVLAVGGALIIMGRRRRV